ncbi:MAG TPA: hypothetical protein VH302_01270 [Bryobacteraceae bacterium]|jgi:hypothetical protein|nr:hypothetical protein [Bryobacteraceae bacterium]
MRTPFTPSGKQKEEVLAHAKTGATEEDIAALLDLPVNKLKRHFKAELRKGAAQGRLDVLNNLHELATSKSNMAATALWVKARCGWRDTGTAAHPANAIKAILEINTVVAA